MRWNLRLHHMFASLLDGEWLVQGCRFHRIVKGALLFQHMQHHPGLPMMARTVTCA